MSTVKRNTFFRRGDERAMGLRPEFGRIGVIPGPGIQAVGMGPLGVAIIGSKKARSASVADVKPFDVSIALDTEEPDPEAADRLVTLRPGTVNGIVPSNMFSTLAVAPTGTYYVVLDMTFASAETTGAALAIDSVSPDPLQVTEGMPPTAVKILIAVIVDAVVFQIRRGNGSVSGVRQFTAQADPPASPGELPYTSYWSYAVSFF